MCYLLFNMRREAIETLCRLFLDGDSAVQDWKDIYRDLVRPLVSDSLPPDIGAFIEGVGDELFSSRPANINYIAVFLEFVSQVNNRVDDSKEIIVLSATNVIERTTFNPHGFFGPIAILCKLIKEIFM